MTRVIICVILMAIVTYIPRALPIAVFRKKIKSKYVRSFLDYTPYAVLGALTFPDIFYSTGHGASALAGAAVAIVLGFFNRSLVEVAIAAITVVYVVEMML